MSKISYRPEIDGLRAVSVIGVVLYHAGLGFPGGYVGVDVFFVISGFLITSIILKDLKAGTFSLIDFWARRIRRILPAVSVMVGVVLVVGFLLLDPYSYRNLSYSAMAQSVVLANVHFWKSVGYFAESSELQILLHTWSLAVEEQFYIIFPFALTLLYRFSRSHTLLILVGVAAVSLLLSGYLVERYDRATFFLLPTRAWELLAGALIAVTQHRFSLLGWKAEALSLGGLVLVVGGMFYYDIHTTFPGPNAMLPVLGAVAFIVGCKDRSTWAGRLLSVKLLVFVGLISYSLYLWHWPVFSFAKHVLIDNSLSLRLSLLLLAVVLSILSWRFVERPFRGKAMLACNASAIKFGGALTAALFLSSLVVWQLDGFSNWQSLEMQVIQEDISWHQLVVDKNQEQESVGLISSSDDNGVLDFALWGDSHAMAISDLVDNKMGQHDLSGEIYHQSRMIPIPGLWFSGKSESENKEFLNRNEAYLQSIIDRRIPHLILVSRWSIYCAGYNQVELDHGKRTQYGFVTDGIVASSLLTSELSGESISRQLLKMLDRLSKAGTKVWLIKQVPETGNMMTARHFYLSKKFPSFHQLTRYTTSVSEHQLRQKVVEKAMEGIEIPMLEIIDPSPEFFNNPQERLEVYSKRSHYRDDDHLTRYGADKFLGPIFDDMFSEINRGKEKRQSATKPAAE